jgi:hypothetical protein
VTAKPAVPTIATLPQPHVAGDFAAQGTAPGARSVRLVVDGELGSAQDVAVGSDGRWRATVDTSRFIDPALTHSLNAWVAGGAASAAREFSVVRDWQLRADVEDPAGDDRGLDGRLSYPADPGWGQRHLADIRRVRVFESGGALRLEVELPALSTAWNPPNGFDHVAFTVYIELPDAPGGERVMPLQNALLPEGMRWHLRLRAGGWSNALFGAAGATATNEGTPVTPAAALQVDAPRNSVTFTLPASVLGQRRSLSGAKVYVTTWDYDGGYRALGLQATSFGFGGGSDDGAKVMDDSTVIVLP